MEMLLIKNVLHEDKECDILIEDGRISRIAPGVTLNEDLARYLYLSLIHI